MKRAAAALLACLCFLFSPASRAGENESTMSVGDQQMIPSQDVEKFAVSDKKVLSVAPTSDGARLAVRALSAGFSTVTVYHGDGTSRIHSFLVTTQNVKKLERSLREQLAKFPNVTVEASGSQVILQGFVGNKDQLQVIKDLARSYGPSVIPIVTVGASGMQPTKMVRLELVWVQVRQRGGSRIGLRWPSSFGGGQVSVQGDFAGGSSLLKSAPFSLVSDLFPVLDLNALSGAAKILRSHELVTENGIRASTSNGAEIYVRLVSGLGNSKLEKIFFGAELSVTPTLSPQGDVVTMEVSSSVTERDNSSAQDGLPGRIVDKVDTTVHVPLGQSMMLSGVKLKAWSESRSGVPGVCKVPVLNFFFCSRTKEVEDADGLLFITPTVVQATSAENKQRIAKALSQVESLR